MNEDRREIETILAIREVEMNEFRNFSDDALRAELERREKKKQIEACPEPLQNIDFEPLKEICGEYIDDLANCYADEDGDYAAHIYECAMGCIYGREVWAWINKRMAAL